MKSLRRFALACGLTLLSAAALAHEYRLGSLEIGHPWVRATPRSAPVGGGFLTIANTGAAADRLLAVKADVSEKVELHEMSMDGGIMKMRALPEGIAVPAGGRVELKPGGYHVMFIGLKAPLEAGKSFKGTLQFEKAGPIEVDFMVQGMSADPMDHSGMKPMGH